MLNRKGRVPRVVLVLGAGVTQRPGCFNQLGTYAVPRLDFALRYLVRNRGKVDYLILSGGITSAAYQDVSEAELGKRYLTSLPGWNQVGDVHVLLEEFALDSHQNIKKSMELVRSLGIREFRLVIISQWPHHALRGWIIATRGHGHPWWRTSTAPWRQPLAASQWVRYWNGVLDAWRDPHGLGRKAVATREHRSAQPAP